MGKKNMRSNSSLEEVKEARGEAFAELKEARGEAFAGLKEARAQYFVRKIGAMFDKFDGERSAQLSDIAAVREAIYGRKDMSRANWRTNIELPDIYESAQTLKAYIMESVYSNPDGMFDVKMSEVSGRGGVLGVLPAGAAGVCGVLKGASAAKGALVKAFAQAEGALEELAHGSAVQAEGLKGADLGPTPAEIQKQILVDAFEKMDFRAETEKIVNDIVETGESVLFVGWGTEFKRVRCLADEGFEGAEADEGVNEPAQADAAEDRKYFKDSYSDDLPVFIYKEKKVFDGVKVRAVSPLDFVFDVSRRGNWESCPKIFRKYVDLEDLKDEGVNTLLTPLKAAQLREMTVKKGSSGGYGRSFGGHGGSSGAGVKNGQLEVLEFWGDIALEDGKVLKNVLIVVAGRRFVIRAEVNPFVNTPFIYANIIEDPTTGRGLSPLRVGIPLNKISSTILNKQLDALSLIMNPPYLAPKGAFKGVQEVEPGKIIEYDASLLPQTPAPLGFERALCGWDFIKYFKSGIESATGVFKTMAGDVAPAVRTATELNYSLGGQSTRLNLILENINRKLIVPMVEKTAQTIANFKFGAESVFVVKDGVSYACEADDELRCGDFCYRYGDRKALLERKNKFMELYQVISGLAGVEELRGRIDWAECFRFALEQYGIENAAKFLKA